MTNTNKKRELVILSLSVEHAEELLKDIIGTYAADPVVLDKIKKRLSGMIEKRHQERGFSEEKTEELNREIAQERVREIEAHENATDELEIERDRQNQEESQ